MVSNHEKSAAGTNAPVNELVHRITPWRLAQGLYIPHSYPGSKPLSWWGDVGFVLNGRRVMVWWVHPRRKYLDEIEARVMRDAEPMPDDEALVDKQMAKDIPFGTYKNYLQVSGVLELLC